MDRDITIEAMQRGHWARVRSIYGEGLATGLAAFMLNPPVWQVWDARHLALGRLVAIQEGALLGWCALARAADT